MKISRRSNHELRLMTRYFNETIVSITCDKKKINKKKRKWGCKSVKVSSPLSLSLLFSVSFSDQNIIIIIKMRSKREKRELPLPPLSSSNRSMKGFWIELIIEQLILWYARATSTQFCSNRSRKVSTCSAVLMNISIFRSSSDDITVIISHHVNIKEKQGSTRSLLQLSVTHLR